MQVLCLEDVLKNCFLRKTSKTELSFWENMESLIQSGSAELCGVMNQDFSCILMLQQGVFFASLHVSLCVAYVPNILPCVSLMAFPEFHLFHATNNNNINK